jgi:hypothetical protein
MEGPKPHTNVARTSSIHSSGPRQSSCSPSQHQFNHISAINPHQGHYQLHQNGKGTIFTKQLYGSTVLDRPRPRNHLFTPPKFQVQYFYKRLNEIPSLPAITISSRLRQVRWSNACSNSTKRINKARCIRSRRESCYAKAWPRLETVPDRSSSWITGQAAHPARMISESRGQSVLQCARKRWIPGDCV